MLHYPHGTGSFKSLTKLVDSLSERLGALTEQLGCLTNTVTQQGAALRFLVLS